MSVPDMTLLWVVLVPFLASPIAALLGGKFGRRTGYLAAAAFLPALSLALPLLGVSAAPGGVVLPWAPQFGLEIKFIADGFSLLFAAMIGLIGVLANTYAVAYLSSKERFGRFYSYLLLFGGSMLGLVLSDNLVAMFGFWEMTSITSFLLIGLWHARAAARDGAVKAFLLSALGGLGLLASVAMIGVAGGSFNLSQIDHAALQASLLFVPAMLLALLAAFTKSAQLPFHLWLPTAMEAPTPVSAFLHSATMVKAGVLLVAKFGLLFGASALWPAVVVPVGLATMFWGSYLGFKQTDLKALLAFSTISQLGLLMSLYGLADEAGRFAATVHLINHAAFKAALFFVVGIIDHETGTREIPKLSGLRKVFPLTFILAVLASLSMAGIPPLGGFVSKELFYENMLHHGPAFIAVAVLGSALTLAYTLRFLSVFMGELRHPGEQRPERPNNAILMPIVPLVAAAVLFGLWPASAEKIARGAAEALRFADHKEHLHLWHGVTPALIATLITWALGALLWFKQDAWFGLQRRLTPSWNANTAYYAIRSATERFATEFILRTQGLALPNQLRFGLFAAAALVLYAFLRDPHALSFAPQFSFGVMLIVTLLLAGAGGVALSRNRITSVVLMGLTGFGTAAAFLHFRAPDLALTQMVIETITVVLFLLAFRYLPGVRAFPRTKLQYVSDVFLAVGGGAAVFVMMLASQEKLAPSISPYYLWNAYKGGGGNNVVNVTLVDFRGFDTFGEIAVVGMVGLAVLSLVSLGKVGNKRPEYDTSDPTANMSLIPTRQERARVIALLRRQGVRPVAAPVPVAPPPHPDSLRAQAQDAQQGGHQG